jgi:hypothetical protein
MEEFKGRMIHVQEPGCFSFLIAADAPRRYIGAVRCYLVAA